MYKVLNLKKIYYLFQKLLFIIIGLSTQTCLSKNQETTKHSEHTNHGNNKKVSKRDYYAPEYNHDQYVSENKIIMKY